VGYVEADPKKFSAEVELKKILKLPEILNRNCG